MQFNDSETAKLPYPQNSFQIRRRKVMALDDVGFLGSFFVGFPVPRARESVVGAVDSQ